jgi:predicted nucleic acid-binding protein
VKTYVFDASALFIFLEKKTGAAKIGELLRDAMRNRAEILMSSVNCGEVYGKILREYGPDRAAATMSAIYPLPIHMVDATQERSFRAAEIKAKYKLFYVDSFAAALTIENKATLVTSDSDFRKISSFPVMWLKNLG